MKDRWQDPEYQAEMSRMSTETNADPAMKQLHSECMTNYLAEHPDHIRILTEANIAWCKEHPEKKIEAAKNGHKAMAQKGNRSSIEVKLENAIIAAGLPFQAQWEHKLGVADFLVGTQVVVFADGDYWHSSQKAQEKDARHNQSLTEQGYQVLRFWEHKINSNVQECIRIIQKAFENETNQCQIAVVKLDTLSPGNTPNNEH